MAGPPPPPPPPGPPVDPVFPTSDGSGGNNGGLDSFSQSMLRNLASCGYNETELENVGVNLTYAVSLNFTDRLTYWQHFLSVLNCSDGTPPSSDPIIVPASIDAAPLIAYFVTIMVLGLTMNVCVIGTIAQVRRLRTVTNAFVLSLATADFLMAAVVIPLQIYELVNPQIRHEYVDSFFPILGVASLLNLCTVTLDRFFTITKPLTYEAKVSTARVGVIIAGLWIISIAQECFRLTIGRAGTANANKADNIYQIVRFVVVFSIPFICVLFVNAKIYLIARRHSKQIDANNPNNADGRSSRSFSKKLKTARVIGLLVGTFVLTWLPYFIMTVYEINNPDPLLRTSSSLTAIEIGNIVCPALASSTALFNPLLYGLTRKEVRQAMWRFVKCQSLNQMNIEASASAVTTKRNGGDITLHRA